MIFQDIYKWEIELIDGTVITKGHDFAPDDVIRVSYISRIFPRHDIIFDDKVKYVKRFSRGFIRTRVGMVEYIHCTITNAFRFYLLSSSGRILITNKDYDLYI